MDSIGPTFKSLRGRNTSTSHGSPYPTGLGKETASSALLQEKVRDLEAELSRKRPSAKDDPFFEEPAAKSSRTGTVVHGVSSTIPDSATSCSSSAPFLRDQNLRSAVSRERTPSGGLPAMHENGTAQLDKTSFRVVAASTHSGHSGHSENTEFSDAPDSGAGDGEEIPDDVSLEVLEEMNKLEENFPVLAERYRLIDKIGEGTFSTVYKAEAIDGAVMLGSQMWKSPPLKNSLAIRSKAQEKQKKKNPLVALKQIYVTSSPNRIHNELNLLFMLSGNAHVAPLLDILRHQDQVLAILPYYQHADFRDFYRDIPIKGIKNYMWELFQGLEFMHSKGIIHRDLKPTNFLYDPFKGKGVLVDFGLAEKMAINSPSSRSSNSCPCLLKDRSSLHKSHSKRLNIKAAYPKVDQRPPRRANRAGTRGFRAPEVLFKCTNQTTKIDIWSAGIIGLSLLARKFPLFNSPDDIDALMEIILIFGVEKVSKCAELHGCGLEMNAPSMQMTSFNGNLIRFLITLLVYEEENECLPPDSVIYDTLKFLDRESNSLRKPALENLEDATIEAREQYRELLEEYGDLKHLVSLLYGCLSLDASKRLSASSLLKMPFFSELTAHEDDDVLL